MSHSNNVAYDPRGQVVTGQPTHSQPSGFNQVAYAQGTNIVKQPHNAGYGPPQPPGATPGHVIFMERPPAIPGIPQGLEYLSQIDQLLVHQQVELFEMITGWETSNKYQIKNSLGQQVYFAGEESDACGRLCCGAQRGFVMHITDNFGAEVIRATRHFKCCAGCNCCANIDCCAMELHIEAPVGQICGYAKQTRSCITPHFVILDANRQPVFNVIGPMCICQGPCCTKDQEFKIFTLQGSLIGKLSKQWSGFTREFFTDADNFSATFPLDLDVRMKAVVLCTVFLIDFMYFEQQQNSN